MAALDSDRRRLQVVLVNFRYRYPVRRHVHLRIDGLPNSLASGTWEERTVDSLHSNVFTDQNRCELEITNDGNFNRKSFAYDRDLLANSIVLLELRGKTE